MASPHRDIESPLGPASQTSLVSTVDIEKAAAVHGDVQDGLTDTNVVEFGGPSDSDNPVNWSRNRKWILLWLVSSLQLMVNLATLMCTPAVPLIQKDFGTTGNSAYQILIVTIWEFGEAFAPLLVAPLSETYGRLPIIHISNVLFIAFSIASAVSTSTSMLIAFRFFNGLAVSIIVLAPSIVGDLFAVEERGRAMALMGLLPILGPLAGPAIGGYVSETIGWRWMFWITAAATGVIELGFLCFFRETYKVTILERKAARLRKETGNPHWKPAVTAPRGVSNLLRIAFIRPARMLFLSKIIFLNAFYVSVVFSYLYFLLTTITEVFQTNYGFSTGEASLTFLGLGLGMTIGMFVCRFTLDKYVQKMKEANAMTPERRLGPMIVGGVIMPIGLFLYGWTAQAKVHWMAPIIGLSLMGFGVATTIIPSFSYLVDAFGIHAASALAANICLRCVAGFALPLAAPALYHRLGLGWGNSVLGFIALAFLPVPFIMMKRGERIRKSSKLEVIF